MTSQATATRTGYSCTTLRSPFTLSARQTRYVRLAALPSAAGWARRVLRHALREWQLQSMEDSAALLVSELVTNAVQASAGLARRDRGKLSMIGLEIRLTASSLVLEVWDANPLRPVAKNLGTAADHGRGLVLVDALADSWGDRSAYGGKVVWCELTIPPLAGSTSIAS